jgi:hypothetical protein
VQNKSYSMEYQNDFFERPGGGKGKESFQLAVGSWQLAIGR